MLKAAKKMFLVGLMALGLMAFAPASAFAQTPTPPNGGLVLDNDRFVVAQDLTLHSGETIAGDVVVVGGTLTMEEGSRVSGSVSVVGGSADIYGSIAKDLAVIGGEAHVRPTAKIEGEANVFGGHLTKDPGATVLGGESSAVMPTPVPPELPAPLKPLIPPNTPAKPKINFDFSALGSLSSIAFITLFAILVMLVFPNNIARAAQTYQSHGLLAGGLGMALWLAVAVFVIVCAITICLLPFALLAAVIWLLVVLFGWSVSALWLGKWLLKGFGKINWTPIGQMLLGALILAVLGQLPGIGFFAVLAATALGAGALLLTRFGSRAYAA
ncbi:MAG TPA: hypothetical protein PLJ62_07605 [Thermoflexales bacterium]|nr:hypothetical protein [Thermoflexales bacterium]HQW33814.1 hypothetical protein [Thermoflexales bacterium]HQZ23408.1 hypothetical protein [Thermoflexales bacterium]HRA00047.1 hypothetical protein [Thermoflexales bacterium]